MTDPRFDVVVVGNVGIDTNVYFYGNDVDFSNGSSTRSGVAAGSVTGRDAWRGVAAVGRESCRVGATQSPGPAGRWLLDGLVLCGRACRLAVASGAAITAVAPRCAGRLAGLCRALAGCGVVWVIRLAALVTDSPAIAAVAVGGAVAAALVPGGR